ADRQYLRNYDHSSDSGTLEIYWVRERQNLKFYPIRDASFKYQTTVDAYGQAESAWYLCPRDTGQSCITEPFWWELEPDVKIQLMSLTLPVKAGERFLGVAGVDLEMPDFVTTINELIRPLYGGNVRYYLLSGSQRLLASNDYPGRSGEYLTQIAPDIAALADDAGSNLFQQGEQSFRVERLQLPILNQQWQMLLLIPQQLLLQEFNQVQQQLTRLSVRNMVFLILSFGLLILITLVIALRYLHRRESLLSQSQAELASILLAAPTPIAVAYPATQGFTLSKVNQAWLQQFGFQSAEHAVAIAAHEKIWSSAADQQRLMTQLQQEGEVNAFLSWLVRQDGSEFLAEVSAALLSAESQPLLIIVYEDVTTHYQLQRQLLQSNELLEQRVSERTQQLTETIDTLARTQQELIQSEKLAALGNLVAGMAHELNTPVGNAVMATSRLKADIRLLQQQLTQGLTKTDLQNFIAQSATSGDIMERNLQRAIGLISSFKQVAVDQTSLQRRQAQLADIVQDVMLMLQPSIRKSGHQVQLSLPQTPLILDTYPGPLEQVLINLIQNALIHAFKTPGGIITLTAAQQDTELLLQIFDNGTGIPADIQAKIFEPFFTTRLGQGGSGLGLSLVHNMVTGILKGHISLHSTPGEGSCFSVVIPLVVPAQ
ncbi:MAG: ATP-binding protein, partial [Alishewanella aestuarii]